MMRLDKYLADMGKGTRQEVKKYIRKGLVTVDGVAVCSPEYKVEAGMEILLDKGRNLGASHKFKKLIDNQFRKDGAPKSVFLWRLGSNMCRITGHTDRCRVDFAKLIAPKFFVVRC